MLIRLFSLLALALLLPPTSADQNVTVTDDQIIWPSTPPQGPWSPTSSICSPEGLAHYAPNIGMSVNYTFTGNALYLSVRRGSSTGTYSVTIDNGSPVLIDGFHPDPSLCDIQFTQTGLPLLQHTVNVTLTGPSPQIINPPPGTSVNLEVDGFIFTIPDEAASVTPSSSPPSSAPTPSPSRAPSSSPASPLRHFPTTLRHLLTIAICLCPVVIINIMP